MELHTPGRAAVVELHTPGRAAVVELHAGRQCGTWRASAHDGAHLAGERVRSATGHTTGHT